MLTRSKAKLQMSVPFDNPEVMFRGLKVYFNKGKSQAAAAASNKSSALTTSSSESTSIATMVNVNENENVNANKTKYHRLVCVWQYVQSILGVAGGVYAIYQFVNTYIIRHPEIMEVMVLRRT